PRELVRRPADDFVAALLGRHRFQLRLMTTTVRDALATGGAQAHDAGARSVGVPARASVWEALEGLEGAGAPLARVDADDDDDRDAASSNAPRFLSREALLAAARD